MTPTQSLLLFNTVRYLKPVQVYARAIKKITRSRPDSTLAPPLRTLTGAWISHVVVDAGIMWVGYDLIR